MASTVLPNGIIVPEKFSRDWYADLYHNWQELDNLLGGGTPKDGTLTIQKNGSTVGTFSANQATDETINIEVPDVNNGTLTIQQNSTTVDTFTANSSSDKTVNIQCVDLTNNQTVGGIKTFSNAPVVGSMNLDGKTIDTDANDNMTYDGHIVDTIEEQGEGYIRYTNGIQICWVEARVVDSSYNWSFPKTFLQKPVTTATIFYPSDSYNLFQRSAELNNLSNTGVLLREAVHQFGSNTYITASDYVEAIAIGKWK